MILEPIQYLLGALSGSLVGFTLGLVGGGGSILAVPLIDMARVMFVRLVRRSGIFSADREHLHHRHLQEHPENQHHPLEEPSISTRRQHLHRGARGGTETGREPRPAGARR